MFLPVLVDERSVPRALARYNTKPAHRTAGGIRVLDAGPCLEDSLRSCVRHDVLDGATELAFSTRRRSQHPAAKSVR
jgi:hypothetical protein